MVAIRSVSWLEWSWNDPLVAGFRWERGLTPAASITGLIFSIYAYLFMVYVLHNLMKLRKSPLPLGPIPALHNLVLLVGSLVMFVGLSISARVEIEQSRWLWGPMSGRKLLLCFPPGTRSAGRVFFWSYIYYISKYYETLDTVLLLLRKKPLTFLHIFHHATVILMSFLWLEFAMSLQIVAILANTGVHVFMYTYYFLCSVGRPPKWKKAVTNSQIVQFIFSFVASAGTGWFHFTSFEGCAGMVAWIFSAIFNFTLLMLFLNFHRTEYSKKAKSREEGGDVKKEVGVESKEDKEDKKDN